MRLCRFDDDRFGVVRADTVYDVTGVLSHIAPRSYPYPRHDVFIGELPRLRGHIEEALETGTSRPLGEVSLLSPVANPGKIMAAPVNYLAHLDEARTDPQVHHQNRIEEIQRVGLFLKATSSMAGPSEGVTIGLPERRNDHEIELVAIIGRRGRNISETDALSYVAGYCIGLDMTVRGPEERSLRKSVDSYSVLGPWMVTADELTDPVGLAMTLKVNGERRQFANTRDLILGVPQLIAFASRFYTLHPGDILFTGTPEGVGPVVPGDQIAAEIAGIGRMAVDIKSL